MGLASRRCRSTEVVGTSACRSAGSGGRCRRSTSPGVGADRGHGAQCSRAPRLGRDACGGDGRHNAGFLCGSGPADGDVGGVTRAGGSGASGGALRRSLCGSVTRAGAASVAPSRAPRAAPPSTSGWSRQSRAHARAWCTVATAVDRPVRHGFKRVRSSGLRQLSTSDCRAPPDSAGWSNWPPARRG